LENSASSVVFPLKLLVQARGFDAMLVPMIALNIIADLHPGIFMPNVSYDYRNLELPESAQKNLTSHSVTRGS